MRKYLLSLESWLYRWILDLETRANSSPTYEVLPELLGACHDIVCWVLRRFFPATDAQAAVWFHRNVDRVIAERLVPVTDEDYKPLPTAPDAYCITTPDGDCISDDPRCMHNRRPLTALDTHPEELPCCNGSGCGQCEGDGPWAKGWAERSGDLNIQGTITGRMEIKQMPPISDEEALAEANAWGFDNVEDHLTAVQEIYDKAEAEHCSCVRCDSAGLATCQCTDLDSEEDEESNYYRDH